VLHSLRENRTLLIIMLECFFDTNLLVPCNRQLPRPAGAAHLRPVGVIQNSFWKLYFGYFHTKNLW